MIDLPPPSYEQTIAAILQCEIPRGNIRIKYEDYLQSDEVSITDLGEVTDVKLRCLKNAVDPSYILTVENVAQNVAFYDFSAREDRPRDKAEALNWLSLKNLEGRVPKFDAKQGADKFITALGSACGLKRGSNAISGSGLWVTIRPDAITMKSPEKSTDGLECLIKMFTASNAFENGIKLGFLGNAPLIMPKNE